MPGVLPTLDAENGENEDAERGEMRRRGGLIFCVSLEG